MGLGGGPEQKAPVNCSSYWGDPDLPSFITLIHFQCRCKRWVANSHTKSVLGVQMDVDGEITEQKQ